MFCKCAKVAARKLTKRTMSSTSSSSQAGTTDSASRKGALIFLHGLGDQGNSWHMQLAPMLPAHIKCVTPTAPTQKVTLNFGMKCNSWFDLLSLNPNDPEDEPGIEVATKRIHEIIESQEKQGVPNERIILGGFSQGGALALHAAFTYPKKLAGVVALSCWLPLRTKFPAACSSANKSIPVLQCHGDQDFVVPLGWGQSSANVMSKFLDSSNFAFKIYKGVSHSSSPAELEDVLEFIRKQVPK